MANNLTTTDTALVINEGNSIPRSGFLTKKSGDEVLIIYQGQTFKLNYKTDTIDDESYDSAQELFDAIAGFLIDGGGSGEGLQSIVSGGANVTIDDTDPKNPVISVSQSSVSVSSEDITDSTAIGRALVTAATAASGRTTLGLGSASTHPAGDFATSAQGALADSALQDVGGLIEQGSNVTISGSGTAADPYVINSSGGGGGGGAVDSVNGQTGVVVLGAEDVGAATAAQGALADTALQSVSSGDISDATATGTALLTSSNAAAARTTLGLGTAATQASTAFAAAVHTHNASDINAGTLDVARVPNITASKVTDFAATTRSTALTGLSTSTGTAITATDTVLSGFGKLQKQVTDLGTNNAVSIISVTANKTLALSDALVNAKLYVSTAANITIPTNATVAFPLGSTINLLVGGVSCSVIAASGVTITSKDGLTSINQNTAASLVKVDTNTWFLIGDLT